MGSRHTVGTVMSRVRRLWIRWPSVNGDAWNDRKFGGRRRAWACAAKLLCHNPDSSSPIPFLVPPSPRTQGWPENNSGTVQHRSIKKLRPLPDSDLQSDETDSRIGPYVPTAGSRDGVSRTSWQECFEPEQSFGGCLPKTICRSTGSLSLEWSARRWTLEKKRDSLVRGCVEKVVDSSQCLGQSQKR